MAMVTGPQAAIIVSLLTFWLGPIWLDSKKRSYDLERQNRSPKEGGYSLDDYLGFMKIIGNDNIHDPRGNNATLAEFARLRSPPTSVLEIGPGSGDFGRMMARKFPNATIVGIDAHELSLSAARSLGENPDNLRFELRTSNELSEPPQSYDVITTTYVNHEIFPDQDFVEFLRRVKVVGRKAFIFNDYFRSFGCLLAANTWFTLTEHGHALNKYAIEDYLPIGEEKRAEFKARKAVPLTQTASAMKLATDGGWQSMRRAFSLDEYAQMFKQAGYPAEALTCTRHDSNSLADWVSATCRVTCFADLTMDAQTA